MLSTVVWAQAEKVGPLGPEFGKASPVGLLIIILLLVCVAVLGYFFARRMRRMNRRRAFAEDHGIDFFDGPAIDKAMAEAGLAPDKKKYWL